MSWHPLAVFCRALEEALGHGVQANAYYTPRGSQGFAVHHDTHDVLILQVAGEKRWLLYDPLLELPLKHQRYSRGARRARRADRRSRAQGGRLALPAARVAPPGRDVGDRLAAPHDRDRARTRGSTPHGARSRPARTSSRSGAASSTARRTASPTLIAAQLDPELVEQRRRRQFVESRRPIREDGLSQLRALERLDAGHAARAARDGDRRPRRTARRRRARLRGQGDPLPARTPRPRCGRASRATSRSGSTTCPASSTPKGRLVLARRLVREGFLRITG